LLSSFFQLPFFDKKHSPPLALWIENEVSPKPKETRRTRFLTCIFGLFIKFPVLIKN